MKAMTLAVLAHSMLAAAQPAAAGWLNSPGEDFALRKWPAAYWSLADSIDGILAASWQKPI